MLDQPVTAPLSLTLEYLRQIFHDALLRLDRGVALDVLSQALANGYTVTEITERCVAPTLEFIGNEWEAGRLALSQVFMASRIAEDTVDQLFPQTDLSGGTRPVIALALLEDYHALGKRLVALSLRSAGYAIHDYGHVSAQELVEKSLADSVEVLLVSTLMLRSALQVRAVCDGLAQAGRSIPVIVGGGAPFGRRWPRRFAWRSLPVIVGGAPFRFDPDLWREVGASATGASASDAIRLVQQFLERPHAA